MTQFINRMHTHNGTVGEGIKFQRIRRVTGYLVSDLSRWNNSKLSELHDRVKHAHL